MNDVCIIPTALRYAGSLNATVDIVARERRYIGFVEGPSIESTRGFVQRILAGAGVQMLVVTPSDSVVGWCDIIRNPQEGFRHVGRLGWDSAPSIVAAVWAGVLRSRLLSPRDKWEWSEWNSTSSLQMSRRLPFIVRLVSLRRASSGERENSKGSMTITCSWPCSMINQ